MAENDSTSSCIASKRAPYIRELEKHVIPMVYSGRFEIDGDGSIWRRRSGVRVRAENKGGDYLQVRVMVCGVRYHACAHRVVWAYFNGPIPSGMVINHKNGNKTDNRPGNLEATTPSGNLIHAHSTGLVDQRGQRNPAAKLSDADVTRIRLEYAEGGVTQQQLAKRYGVAFQTISKIVRGNARASNLGPTSDYTARRKTHQVHDSKTGRFLGKAAAGCLLDGREHKEFPA